MESAMPSLDEILKPFAGLSQLLAPHDFKTLEDFNRMINKVAEELEAMREDRLNDGRPLGPLQVQISVESLTKHVLHKHTPDVNTEFLGP